MGGDFYNTYGQLTAMVLVDTVVPVKMVFTFPENFYYLHGNICPQIFMINYMEKADSLNFKNIDLTSLKILFSILFSMVFATF